MKSKIELINREISKFKNINLNNYKAVELKVTLLDWGIKIERPKLNKIRRENFEKWLLKEWRSFLRNNKYQEESNEPISAFPNLDFKNIKDFQVKLLNN